MRNMILLHGCPGSGKTSLIDALGVGHLTLSYDAFRAMFATTVPVGDAGAGWFLGSGADDHAVEACHAAAEVRMNNGETLFIDATNVKSGDQAGWVKRARRYGYRVFVLDVQGDMSYDEAVRRNAVRGVARIDGTVLRTLWELGARHQVHGGATAITVDDLPGLFELPAIRAGRTVVVGDVHSCAAPLAAAVDDHDTPDTHWVFVGDLFDRGPDPLGVHRIITERLAGRVTCVLGNHEQNIWRVVNGTHPFSYRDTRDTVDVLRAAGLSDEAILDVAVSCVPAAVIRTTSDGPDFIVTHGGVGATSAARIRAAASGAGDWDLSDVECVGGIGDRGLAYLGRFDYSIADAPVAGFQFHGHRTGPRSGPMVALRRDLDSGPVWCLDRGAGDGGALGVAVLDAAGRVETHVYADGVDVSVSPAARPQRPQRPRMTLTERMEASPLVKVRPVKGFDDIVACNFTRGAFREGTWNPTTVAARGLFLRAATGEVVARGYDKFFHIGEEPSRSRTAWDRAAWPVIARRKVNGFLALVASVDGQLVVWTKSGPTPYSTAARQMLDEACGGADGTETLRQILESSNSTALLEVVRTDDPHPITDGVDRIVLLDVVANTEQFTLRHRVRDGIVNRFGFELAETVGTATNADELADLIAEIEARDDEGAVLIDAAGYRAKVKARRYADRKAMRGALTRVWSTRRAGKKHPSADELFPGDVARRLRESGVWDAITEYTVISPTGHPVLDLASLCDDAGL